MSWHELVRGVEGLVVLRQKQTSSRIIKLQPDVQRCPNHRRTCTAKLLRHRTLALTTVELLRRAISSNGSMCFTFSTKFRLEPLSAILLPPLQDIEANGTLCVTRCMYCETFLSPKGCVLA